MLGGPNRAEHRHSASETRGRTGAEQGGSFAGEKIQMQVCFPSGSLPVTRMPG